MAKEMMIIFVYDTQMVQKEEDDPFTAILYFHPSWVSDQQKTALCGQLMGTAHCIKSILSTPQIISLQSGKFFIKEYGRYFMAVGTDRNIADWLLEHRANTMASIISFFHQDIETMAKNYENTERLSTNLYLLFETYLKYLFMGANIFSYTPVIKLPKSASNVFLEAIQILQCCQEINYVLGGTVLYHNKYDSIFDTLTHSADNQGWTGSGEYSIILMDSPPLSGPVRGSPKIRFLQPHCTSQHKNLRQRVKFCLSVLISNDSRVVATQLSSDLTKTIVLTDPYRIKCPAELPGVNFETPIGVQLLQVYITGKEYFRLNNEAVRSRTVFQFLANKSIRKTQTKCGKELVMSAMKRDQSIIFTAVPEEDADHSCVEKMEQCNGGKPVELQNRPKFLNLKSKITDVNIIENKNNKPAPFTPNHGQISVCSTPMTDLNKMVHTRPLSICTNLNELAKPYNNRDDKATIENFQPVVGLKLKRNLYDCKKYSSAFDIREQLKSIESSITMKYYKIDLIDKNDKKDCLNQTPHKYQTITDPYYPIFRSDGTVVSRSLYESSLQLEFEQISHELYEQEQQKTCKSFDNFDYCAVDLLKKTIQQQLNKTDSNDDDTNKIKRNSNRDRRKSLTLPLKSLSIDADGSEPMKLRRHSSGIQLTPLMSKLSSFDDRSSGFGSCEATPNDYRLFTPTQTNFQFQYKKIMKSIEQNDGSLKRCVLFICGQQDMVVALLLQEDCVTSSEAITRLWEICTENLGKLEKQLHHCLETYPASNLQTDSEPYSYLHLDQEWDTMERGGPWGNTELGTLTHFYRDFKNDPSLTEILVRCADGVIYGHRCGNSEVFYHQPASNTSGIPTPADPMGNVPLKAKRRLERDHSIILL